MIENRAVNHPATRIFNQLMKQIKIEVTKFTLVGALNFVLTLIIFSVALKIFEAHYLAALGTSWFFGMLFSYALNYKWVFKPDEKIKFNARFAKFLATGLLSITLNMLTLNYLVRHSEIDPFYLQFCLIPFIVIFNFTAAKFWSLR